MSMASPERPLAVSWAWPSSRGKVELMALSIDLARVWLVCDMRRRITMSCIIEPPSRMRPLSRFTASRSRARGCTNGLMKIGPRASASGLACRLPVTSGPGRSSVVQSVPPSRLVEPEPGTAKTRTSNFCSLGAPGGITPSTMTTAQSPESSIRSGVMSPNPVAAFPTPLRAISCSMNARTSAGMRRLPVPSSPTTRP
jgi:hypothetical protein